MLLKAYTISLESRYHLAKCVTHSSLDHDRADVQDWSPDADIYIRVHEAQSKRGLDHHANQPIDYVYTSCCFGVATSIIEDQSYPFPLLPSPIPRGTEV